MIVAPMAIAQNVPGTNETSGVTNDAYLKTGNGSSGGMDFYTAQIAGIGTGMLGSSIITQCLEGLKTPSIATFMAGSLVHIASEIIGAKAKNDRNKKKIKDLKLEIEDIKKKGDSAQLESLKALLVEEEDTYEFLKNRKKWMIAVDVIYAAAVGLAIAEAAYGITARSTSATAGCTAKQTPIAAAKCAATLYGVAACIAADLAIEIPLCVANATASAEGVKAAYITHSAARTALKTACAGVYYAECVAAGEVEFGLAYAACKDAPVDGGASMFSWTGLLGMAYGFGAGQLNKDGGQVSQYGSMAVSLLTAFVPAVSKAVARLYNFPIPRSITFGALLVMAGINTAGLAKRENISSDNIEKLNDGIAQFKVEADGTETGIDVPATIDPESGGNNAVNPNKTKPKIKDLIVNKPKTCISNSGGKWDISEKSCGNPIKLKKTNFSNFGLPVLTNVTGLATDMAQALANGDESKAYAIAGDIGSMAARVKKATEELKIRYNENQKKIGQPTVDFNKKINEQVASIQQSMNQAAAKSNVDLASLGSSSLDKEVPKSADDAPVVTSVAVPGVEQPPVDPFAGMGGTEEYTVDAPPTPTGKSAQNLDDFESTEQDVSKKSDVSIFKQLSNRYILNYTKMFDRKKTPEVAEEPNKN